MREGSHAGHGSGPPEAGAEGAGREQRPKRVSTQSRHARFGGGPRLVGGVGCLLLPLQTACGGAMPGTGVTKEDRGMKPGQALVVSVLKHPSMRECAPTGAAWRQAVQPISPLLPVLIRQDLQASCSIHCPALQLALIRGAPQACHDHTSPCSAGRLPLTAPRGQVGLAQAGHAGAAAPRQDAGCPDAGRREGSGAPQLLRWACAAACCRRRVHSSA